MRFDGINPREISPRIFPAKEIIEAIPPRELQMLSGMNGGILYGVSNKPRQIRLIMNFAGVTHEHANDLARRWAEVVCTDEAKEYEPTHMPGRAFTAILDSAGELEWKWGYGTVEYVFTAPRPYLHSLDETVVRFTGARAIDPKGTVEVQPKIEHVFDSTAEDLRLFIDGKLQFLVKPKAGNFAKGEKVTIDFENRLIMRNSDVAIQMIDYTASTWHPKIKCGSVVSMSDNGQTEVRWRDEWK